MAKKYSRGKLHGKLQNEALSLAAFRIVYICRLVCPLRTLVSRFQRRFFSLKNVFLNCKMSKMHVNHSRVVVDLEKILQCGSAESKTAKLDQTS